MLLQYAASVAHPVAICERLRHGLFTALDDVIMTVLPLRPRRSALYLPAINARAIEKARQLDCDVVILDLEDSVAADQKIAARKAAVAAVQAGGFGHRELVIRANALDTPWGADDLAAISGSGADAVLVPKISGPADVSAASNALSSAPAAIQLWTMVESCAVTGCLHDVAAMARSTRLSLFVMGVNDLAKEMRAPLSADRAVFTPFLAMTVAAARTHGIGVLDGVCNNFRDMDVFTAEAQQGRSFGFDGKTLIHPNQIAPCNAVFSPSADQVAASQRIIDAFAMPENAGKGAISLDGAMVELLHRDAAVATVAMAQAIESRQR